MTSRVALQFMVLFSYATESNRQGPVFHWRYPLHLFLLQHTLQGLHPVLFSSIGKNSVRQMGTAANHATSTPGLLVVMKSLQVLFNRHFIPVPQSAILVVLHVSGSKPALLRMVIIHFTTIRIRVIISAFERHFFII